MIEGGLAVIAACLPTLHFLVRKVSFSSVLQNMRSAFSFGSIHHTQRQLISQASPAHSKESYTHIHVGSSASSTSDAARKENKNPIDVVFTGMVDGHSELQEHGIQVTREFSQHASIV